MKSITYIGMDVHTTNYTLCCYSVEDDRYFAEIEIKPDYREVLKYVNRIQSQRGKEAEVLCGYEAGCLGYSLYHQLTYHGIDCVILAPSTMPVTPGKKTKQTGWTPDGSASAWRTIPTARYISLRKKTTRSKNTSECGMTQITR